MTWSPTSLSRSFVGASTSDAERSTLRLRPPTMPPGETGAVGATVTLSLATEPADSDGLTAFAAGARALTWAPVSALLEPPPADPPADFLDAGAFSTADVGWTF